MAARQARKGDVMELRELDAEGVRVFGVEPSEALGIAAGMSTEHYVVMLDGVIAAAWGYASHGLGSATAYGWLLTSPLVEDHPKTFLRHSRRAVDYILQRCLRLEVTVLREHTTSIRWLEWLGFALTGETSNFLQYSKVR